MAVAEIALTAAINKAIDITSNLAIEEVRRLYWLREDIGWVEREMRRLQSYLEDADAKQHVGSPDAKRQVANFLNDIRDLAYDVEDILDTFLPQMESHRKKGFLGCLKRATCLFCYCHSAHDFAMEIEKIRRRVADIDVARTRYGITDKGGNAESETWDPRRPFLHVDEPNIVGFDDHIMVLAAKLLDTEIRYDVISIVGMPGLGKTTLAKKVFKSNEHHFECSALVYVSKEPNIDQILREIASKVGLEREKKEEKWEENLEAKLYEILSGKRYVIMFDDIWDTEAWDALKISIPNNSENGSRVILTSRDSEVGRYIGGERSLHKLQPLDPDDSWKLFSKMVMALPGNTNETCVPPELEDIGRQIVKRCGDVPLAIVVTAGLLKSKERTEQAWRGVLGSMGQDQEDKYSKILALSYKDLPINLKPCFLYFGLFPRHHKISAFQIINLWMAEKFIQANGDQTLEDVGEDYLNKLVSKNLIQVVERRYDGRIRTCNIHDLLRTLCIAVAKESNFFHTCRYLTSNSNSSSRVRRVTTHRNSINEYISLDHRSPKLRSLLCFNKDYVLRVKQLKTICEDFLFLRVLRVECNAHHMSIPIPNEIGNLIHLSYLQLRGIESVELPATIRNLKNLLTLDVQGCGTARLPTAIWEMKTLRHILLIDHVIFYSDPIDVSLPNLQTLVACDLWFNINWLHKFRSLRTLIISYLEEPVIEVLSGAIPISYKLEYLRLEFFGGYEIKPFNVSRYRNLSKMHLGGGVRKLPDPDSFPPNLIKLTLCITYLDQDSLETLKMLPKLKILKFGYCSFLGKRMVFSGADNFPQLEVLQLRSLYKLMELVVDEGGMPKLKKLTITNCDNLKMLSDRLRNMMDMRRSDH